MDMTQKVNREEDAGDTSAASSSDIAHLEDSQTSDDGQGSQVAILHNGTTRPLTADEMAEISYHEDLEARAAEREAKEDESRWERFRAQCLQDEEDQAMRDAMEDSLREPPHKKARVKVIVEGAGGRVVRSEVFNMVVHDGEALTYKIMVLPKNDPEVKAMRELEARRDRADGDEEADASNASADTVLADESGRPLPKPTPATNEQLHAFMATQQGERYYQEWNQGRDS